jgi:small subunit ribosomal protein S17
MRRRGSHYKASALTDRANKKFTKFMMSPLRSIASMWHTDEPNIFYLKLKIPEQPSIKLEACSEENTLQHFRKRKTILHGIGSNVVRILRKSHSQGSRLKSSVSRVLRPKRAAVQRTEEVGEARAIVTGVEEADEDEDEMKTVVGKVVSNKMTKSVVVAVQRMWQHPRYPKLVRRTSKFMAHDETNACNIGDEVSSFVHCIAFVVLQNCAWTGV